MRTHTHTHTHTELNRSIQATTFDPLSTERTRQVVTAIVSVCLSVPVGGYSGSVDSRDYSLTPFFTPSWNKVMTIKDTGQLLQETRSVRHRQGLLCGEPRAINGFLFQAWSRSEYSHACFAYSQEFCYFSVCLSGSFGCISSFLFQELCVYQT